MIKYIELVFLRPFKTAFHKFFILFLHCLSGFLPALATRLLHYKRTGRWIDLKAPKDFNEKLQWLKLNEDQSLKSICSDKYAVYGYIEKNYDASILNELIAVYEKPSDIDWDRLPNRFAIKCNHGCGYNIITKNKNELDQNEVVKKLCDWLGEKFGQKSLEPHYDLIEPKIIVEKYIENKSGVLPLDYKIYCFNGIAKLVLICSDRESNLKLDFFDLKWKRLNIGHKKNESAEQIKKPDCFEDMVRHAEALSKPFTFVRVDFYDNDGVPVFGEMTFTPAANMADYYNEYGLLLLGSMLEL